MRSMTGFGRAAGDSPGFRIAVEARSVNHRHLEVMVRMREPFRELEGRMRALVAERVARGRVELAVEIEAHRAGNGSLRVDRDRLVELAEQVAAITNGRADLGLAPVGWGDLLRIPEVLDTSRAEQAFAAEDANVLWRVLADAVEAMTASRAREGQGLAVVLGGLLGELRGLVESVAAELPAVRAQLADRARARLAELVAGAQPARGDASESSWLPEALALAERSDVTEELERLRTHLDHFQETCAAPPPSGRRLDFLTQELLREQHTLSAKCRSLPVAERILEAKLVTERMREQVQNVE